jgi:hypothetical protein
MHTQDCTQTVMCVKHRKFTVIARHGQNPKFATAQSEDFFDTADAL